jgi:hypothetical protein
MEKERKVSVTEYSESTRYIVTIPACMYTYSV